MLDSARMFSARSGIHTDAENPIPQLFLAGRIWLDYIQSGIELMLIKRKVKLMKSNGKNVEINLKLSVTALIILVPLILFSCSDNKSTEPNVVVPQLTTTAVSQITQTTAQCGGTITSDGGASVTARGVCWSTDSIPTIADDITVDGTGTGSFTSSIDELIDGESYFVRAYATNSAGTGYGNLLAFVTQMSVQTDSVTDIDGNVYQTIRIGDQWWMTADLKVTHYRNGDSIPNVVDNGTWEGLGSGAYCDYNHDTANVADYGRLYNWLAATDSRNIAPTGWHVPSDSEWKQLEMFLGMSQASADSMNWRGTDEGSKLKETGTAHWASPNYGATNESGFTAVPSGLRSYDGEFEGLQGVVYYWTTGDYGSGSGWGRHVSVNYQSINRGAHVKQCGFSIRCVKD
jgi:uncharacterized protein (TIGR02145 family)